MHKLSLLLGTAVVWASTLFCIHEQEIAVIIPSYNNALWYEDNLNSVINQHYSNYTIYYIDDCSTDETARLVDHYRTSRHLENKIVLIRNTYNRKAMANIYRVVHALPDDILCVLLDGDDSLAHPNVLATFNELHGPDKAWLSYGQYINVPEEMAQASGLPILGYARETPPELIAARDFRKAGVWLWSGLRGFYAGLFKRIHLYDCILPEAPFKGKFLPSNYDNILMYAGLEMAGNHIKFISDIVLLRNVATPLNDFKLHKDLNKLCSKVIRARPRYPKIDTLASDTIDTRVDLLILSHNAYDTADLIASIESNKLDFSTIFIITDDSSGIAEISTTLDADIHIIQTHTGSNCLVPLLQAIKKYGAPSLLITDDQQRFSMPIDLHKCAEYLKKTHAYGFYLTVNLENFGGANVSRAFMPCEEIDDPLYAWHLACYEPLNTTIHTTALALYPTEIVANILTNKSADSVDQCGQQWQTAPHQTDQVGLFWGWRKK